MVETEAREGGVAGEFDVLGLAGGGPVTGGVVFGVRMLANLVARKTWSRRCFDDVAYEFFVVAYSIGVGGVEEGDARGRVQRRRVAADSVSLRSP